jgi:hypothetical protein
LGLELVELVVEVVGIRVALEAVVGVEVDVVVGLVEAGAVVVELVGVVVAVVAVEVEAVVGLVVVE